MAGRADSTARLGIYAQAIDQATGVFNKVGQSIQGLVAPLKTLRGAALGVAAALGFRKALGAITETVDGLLRIGDAAVSVGVSATEIQALEYALIQAGLGAQKLDSILSKAENARAQALRGQQSYVDAFRTLGIALSDLNQLNAVELLQAVAAGLESIQSVQRQGAALQPLFGEDFRAFLPLLGQGAAQMRTMFDESRKISGALDEQVAAAREYQKQVDLLSQEWAGLTREVVTAFTPALAEAVQFMRELFAITNSFRQSTETLFPEISGKNSVVILRNEIEAVDRALAKVGERLSEIQGKVGFEGERVFLQAQASTLAKLALELRQRFEEAQVAAADVGRELAATAESSQTLDTSLRRVNRELGDSAAKAEKVQSVWSQFALSGISSVSSALVDIAFDAQNAQDHVEDLGRALARLALELAITSALRTAFPGLRTGGVTGGFLGHGPAQKYATGGIARSPQLALFGEGGTAEAFVPLPDGRRIPAYVRGGEPGAGATIINITANDAKSFRDMLARDRNFVYEIQETGLLRRGRVRQAARRV